MTTAAITNAIAESPWPAMNRRPKMVENHSGSSDITQSTGAKVAVRPKSTKPGAPSDRRRRAIRGWAALSCSRDHLRRKRGSVYQATKQKAARSQKTATSRQELLDC